MKGAPGEPVLISLGRRRARCSTSSATPCTACARTSRYPALAGTAVKRDFVEFPSQLNEHWLSTPEVLDRFAVHYQTGKPIPAELVAKIQKAATFNQGFVTVEYLASAIVDIKLHTAPADKPIDPDAFERRR